jgi:hypothetical protein
LCKGPEPTRSCSSSLHAANAAHGGRGFSRCASGATSRDKSHFGFSLIDGTKIKTDLITCVERYR